jgi:hypothetical protein
VPWSAAPDCPVCQRTVSGAPRPYNVQLSTLEFLRARSAIIHRTVWCATGLSGVSAEQRLFGTTVDCKSVDAELQCTNSAAPDCPVPLEEKASNGRQCPNPNGWVTWLAHRTVSGAPIDSSHPQRLCGG